MTKGTIENAITADGVESRMVIRVLTDLLHGPSYTHSQHQYMHGIKQTNTVGADGVAFITLCLIFTGQNVQYRFKVNS